MRWPACGSAAGAADRRRTGFGVAFLIGAFAAACFLLCPAGRAAAFLLAGGFGAAALGAALGFGFAFGVGMLCPGM